MSKSVIVVDARHWLNEDGTIPADGPLRSAAIRMAACIEAAGPLAPAQARATLVACRRRPGGVACLGFLWALKQEDDAILAFCCQCHADEYLIYEWEHTDWAAGPMAPIDVRARLQQRRASAADVPKVHDTMDRLQRALELLGSSLTATRVRELVATAEHPSTVVQLVVQSAGRPPDRLALERFMPVLVELWNTTPRPELGSRAPEAVPKERGPFRAAPKVGRNDPCPCGSGKKHKRCCLTTEDRH